MRSCCLANPKIRCKMQPSLKKHIHEHILFSCRLTKIHLIRLLVSLTQCLVNWMFSMYTSIIPHDLNIRYYAFSCVHLIHAQRHACRLAASLLIHYCSTASLSLFSVCNKERKYCSFPRQDNAYQNYINFLLSHRNFE